MSEECAIVPFDFEKENAYKSNSTQPILIIFLLVYWSNSGRSFLKKLKVLALLFSERSESQTQISSLSAPFTSKKSTF